MSNVVIRDAALEDAAAILKIYAYYTAHTAISFEYVAPSLAVFEERMRRILQKYPYLVAERDGKICGYAYAGPFVGRAAYDWSCELTVYLEHTAQKCGIGKQLYAAMEDKLKAMGVLNLYACIGVPAVDDEYLNHNSADFHAHMGFVEVGRFHNCGYKFDRWYDMIWMEKIIGTHGKGQPDVRAYTK